MTRTIRLIGVACLATSCLLVPTRSHAQVPGQIPGLDLSKAPADIQAIWKKVASGGRPTADESKRLADWMSAHRNELVTSMQQHANPGSSGATGSRAAGAALGGLAATSAHSDQPSCPTKAAKVLASADLGHAPDDAAATALLGAIRQQYTATITTAEQSKLRAILTAHAAPEDVRLIGGLLYLHGDGGAAILSYVAAAEATTASNAAAQRAWGDLGAALIGVRDYAHAIQALRRALALGDRSGWLVTNLGVAYADLGELDSASALLGEAAHLAPKSGIALEALARTQSCAGNMTAAWHTLAKAQEEEFSGTRQEILDRHAEAEANAANGNADDDAAEAAKPMPEPPGKAPFPPPRAGGRPGYFDMYPVKVGHTWVEHAGYIMYNARMAQSFRDLGGQILRERGPQVSSRPPADASSVVFTVVLSNNSDATSAIDLIERRTLARQKMMLAAFTEKHERITTALVQQLGSASDCAAAERASNAAFIDARGAFNVYLSGIEGLSQQMSDAMNAWFEWAPAPDTRFAIDQRRRYLLAALAADAFQAGSVLGNVGKSCGDATKHDAAKPTAKDKRDEGKCESRSIQIYKFAEMEADCHHMTMTAPILTEMLHLPGDPTLKLVRATPDHNGSFDIGMTGDAAKGIIDWNVGARVTWDDGGWIKSSGLTGSATAGAPIGQFSGDVFVSATPGASSANVGASTTLPLSAIGLTQSVSFGGKF